MISIATPNRLFKRHVKGARTSKRPGSWRRRLVLMFDSTSTTKILLVDHRWRRWQRLISPRNTSTSTLKGNIEKTSSLEFDSIIMYSSIGCCCCCGCRHHWRSDRCDGVSSRCSFTTIAFLALFSCCSMLTTRVDENQ